MNPSASGWIEKFGHLVEKAVSPYPDLPALDRDLKSCGFTYGINIGIPTYVEPAHPLSQDENAKINLLAGLYFSYRHISRNTSYKEFIKSALAFYKGLELGQPNLLQKIFSGGKPSSQLEKLLDSRVYLGESILSRTFNSLITNSLLAVDLLTYRAFLRGTDQLKEAAQQMESMVINLVYHSLEYRKPGKSTQKLREVFESSRSFLDAQKPCDSDDFQELLAAYRNTDVARYFLDIICLTVWEDESLELVEHHFAIRQGSILGFEEAEVLSVLKDVQTFFKLHANQAFYLKQSNTGGQLYESMSRLVDKLISRNSKRLKKELQQSGELMVLLSKSTLRELSAEEKKKVQNQLLDIFKSIPSLAIFLLPGGAVLLPIFIKLIPKLLPSSFDENRVEKKEKKEL